MPRGIAGSRLFLPTPSARRATASFKAPFPGGLISTHALREEGDTMHPGTSTPLTYFYPRPPRGGRQPNNDSILKPTNFYPRPPRGGRPQYRANTTHAKLFLPTPSARRATPASRRGLGRHAISTHALREEGDPARARPGQCRPYFYPRPPRGGRQLLLRDDGVVSTMSTHALREEGDLPAD